MQTKALTVFAAAAALCSLLGEVAGHAWHMKHCPPPIGKWPFDVEKFSGEWFIVAKNHPSHFPEEETTCNKLVYAIDTRSNETRFSLKIEKKAGDKTMTPEVMGSFGGHEGGGGLSQVLWRPKADEKWKGPFMMSVLATDYDNYAVVANCKEMYFEKVDSIERIMMGLVWSRKPELDASVLGVLKNVLSGLGLPEDSIKDQDNSGNRFHCSSHGVMKLNCKRTYYKQNVGNSTNFERRHHSV